MTLTLYRRPVRLRNSVRGAKSLTKAATTLRRRSSTERSSTPCPRRSSRVASVRPRLARAVSAADSHSVTRVTGAAALHRMLVVAQRVGQLRLQRPLHQEPP